VELARRAAARQVRVLAGECLPDSGGALEALRKPLQALCDWCRQQGRDETERVLGAGGKALEPYEPALATLPGQEQHPAPAELPADAARLRLFHALDEALGALARERPVLLALDDLQWADELTLGWLESALRRGSLHRHPLLVAGTFRTEEAPAALRALAAAPRVESLTLERLGEAELGTMAGDMLAMESLSESFAKFLARHTEGNPLFAGEYLRTAVAEGVLYRDAQGRWQVGEPGERQATEEVFEALPLPTVLREILERRLEGLGATARRIVEAASVLGHEAPEALLGRMTGGSLGKRMEAAQELLTRQVMEEGAAGLLRFTHDKLREVAYGGLSLRRRQRLHRAAAEGIETQFGSESAEHLASLGQHWERAGVPQRAQTRYLAAARRAVQRYAHEEAERMYRAYLRLAPEPSAETVRVRIELGEDVLRARGEARQAIEELNEALVQARSLGEPELEGEILGHLGNLYRVTGEIEQAHVILQQALSIHRQVGNRRGEGIELAHLASANHAQGRIEEARQLCEQALFIHREVSDRPGEGSALANLANLHREQGRIEEARQLYEQALAIDREIGARHLEGSTLGDLARLECLSTGDLATAVRLAMQGEQLLVAMGDRRELGRLLCHRGHIELAGGRSGRGFLERACALAEDVGAGPESELGKLIPKLRRAVEAFEAGRPLYRGECWTELPEGLQRWLTENGRL
jgi:predicted ATPase